LTNLQKLESDAYRLRDIGSLRNLFADLNYEYEDKPVDKQNWNQEIKNIIQESRIVAKKADYLIFYIKTDSDLIKDWKKVATRIISDNHGFCLVCSHNPSGFQWIFSSLSKEFSKAFTETRHIPIEIKPSLGVPKPFLEFLEAIEVQDNDKGVVILKKISDAFDKFSLKIHDELTANVFEALKTLSEGIISEKNNNLKLDEEVLEKIRSPIFILLYRLIFVLYAEDRGIFPVENPIYAEKFSLKWIKTNWLLNNSATLKLSEYDVQNRLKKLFRLIEVGSEVLEYPTEEFSMRSYYGRLFDRKIHVNLELWKIPNKHFLDVLKLIMGTKDKKGNYFFLDYGALETRHLGSIYEHLLEYHLTVKNNKITELPDAEERRTSASYYTPDYIVEYIVEKSIEPLITEIVNIFPYKDIQLEKILALKILDPAMGSGHFLIGVVNYLARRMCEIEFGEIKEKDLIEKKRDVVRRCIYGVDLNPLAVDLASVALWLETLSSDRPLSFLQAHLKNGNSLLGTNIEQIFDKQTTLWEAEKGRSYFKKSVKEFLMFENLEDDTENTVKIKIEKYKNMHSRGTIYYDLKFLLDCKLAQEFGLKIPPLGDYRAKIGENNLDFYTYDEGPKIKSLSESKNFFHWELEFPEIFFDENGVKKIEGGFDAIVGNPPWVFTRGEHFSEFEKNYFDNHIRNLGIMQIKKGKNIQSGKLNLYSLFLLHCFPILKNNRTLILIIPNNILRTTTYDLVRKYLLDNGKINLIVDLGSGIFEGVSASSIILSIQKEHNQNNRNLNITTIIHSIKDLLLNNFQINKINQKLFYDNPSYAFNIFVETQDLKLNEKILKNSVPLGSLCKYIIEGIVGSKEKDVFDEKKGEIYKPFIVGDDVGRFSLNYKNKFIRYDRNKLHRARPEEVFLSEKIIIQRISGGTRPLIATLDKEKFYTFASVNNIVLKKPSEFSYEYITALLNSDLINWYYSINFSNKSSLTVNISKTYLEQIPIRKISDKDHKEIIKFTNQVLNAKKNIRKQKNTMEKDTLKHQIIELEKNLNNKIYEIYGVNSTERRNIENDLEKK